jgi:hypothetical protein
MKNIYTKLAIVGAAVGYGLTYAGVFAASFFTVPTSTASSLTASVGDQIGDAGTLLVIALAAGIPLAFYVIHQLIGLVPKGRAGRRQKVASDRGVIRK